MASSLPSSRMHPQTDFRSVLGKAQQRDRAAQDEIVRIFAPGLQRYCARHLPRKLRMLLEPEDLNSEAFMQLFDKGPKPSHFTSPAGVATYLQKTALNFIHDKWRREAGSKRFGHCHVGHPGQASLEKVPAAAGVAIEGLARQECQARLDEFLAGQPAKKKAMLESWIAGKSLAAIARKFHVVVRTVECLVAGCSGDWQAAGPNPGG